MRRPSKLTAIASALITILSGSIAIGEESMWDVFEFEGKKFVTFGDDFYTRLESSSGMKALLLSDFYLSYDCETDDLDLDFPAWSSLSFENYEIEVTLGADGGSHVFTVMDDAETYQGQTWITIDGDLSAGGVNFRTSGPKSVRPFLKDKYQFIKFKTIFDTPVVIPLKGVDEAMQLACPRPKTSMAGGRRP
jgi:hypothetical protein